MVLQCREDEEDGERWERCCRARRYGGLLIQNSPHVDMIHMILDVRTPTPYLTNSWALDH